MVTDVVIWTLFIVMATGVFDGNENLSRAEHQFALELFIAQGAVKALDMAIFPKASRHDVECLDPTQGWRLSERSDGKLRAIVTADEGRHSVTPSLCTTTVAGSR